MVFGTRFVQQPDSYTAENIVVGLIYALWAVSYWLQFRVTSYKSIMSINIGFMVFLALYVYFIYYPITFLELFVE
ncbi:hypothetical protein SAMN05421687_1261 [Salimicrobium flavidum]|uniref:Uncharacterized protein n=1 Tax=Salimicrobium flavidum TaxID=570947 RepID=A0A1N7KYN6_9BACI|nr:hypothetical protein SAMN05421687_1261 [Salimicrobium flavidum]